MSNEMSAQVCGCDPGEDNYLCERHRSQAQVIPLTIQNDVLPLTVGVAAAPVKESIVSHGTQDIPVGSAVWRKQRPLWSGVLRYFPDALLEVAHVSWVGNEQHNPGQALHWDRSKSKDEADACARHLTEAGTFDTDGTRHSAKAAWRALALLQKELEVERG